MKKIVVAYSNASLAEKIINKLKVGVSIVATTNLAGNNTDITHGINAISADQIALYEYDYILLVWEDDSSRDELTKLLEKITGEKEKILDFIYLYRLSLILPKVKRVMLNPNYDKLDGLILGMSHAECGIVSRMLPGKVCNLATGAQDIFYNLKVFEYCVKHFPERISSLSYLIFDMWDYPYFNYDVTKSNEAVNYLLGYDGFDEEKHNFDENKEINIPFEKVIEYRYEAKKKEDIRISELISLFDDIYEVFDHEDLFDDFKVKFLNYEMPKDCQEGYKLNNSLSRITHDETIEENKIMFDKLLSGVRRLNPEIAIKIVLIPRYLEIEKQTNEINARWKEQFYRTLDEFLPKYGFQVYDFKNRKDISSHHEYYKDLAHLNQKGARAFTEKLRDEIFSKSELETLNYKNQIRIMFSDFSDDDLVEIIINVLSTEYEVEISEAPDILFYQTEGDSFWNFDCTRVFISENNMVPNFNETDYAISFYKIEYGKRHLTISKNWRSSLNETLAFNDYILSIAKEHNKYNKDPMGCSIHEELEREKRINQIMKKYFRV